MSSLGQTIQKPSRNIKWGKKEEDIYHDLFNAYLRRVNSRSGIYVSNEEVNRNVSKISAFMTSADPRFGLSFSGGVGSGKTTMMRAFYDVCKEYGLRPFSTSAVKIIDHAYKLLPEDIRPNEALELIYDEPYLLIDDIGREPRAVQYYGNEFYPLADLFEYRYNKELFTVVTTNLTASQIEEHYGLRIRDRFREMFYPITFSNPSFR